MAKTMLRLARRQEAGALTALAMQSKAHWGYDRKFLDACRKDLTITEEMVQQHPTYVIETTNGSLTGFSMVALTTPEATLLYLYVHPTAMGKGIGRVLFSESVVHARKSGALWLTWDADPHAVPFYLRMGAYLYGETPSTSIPGRMLPVMRFDLTDC